MELDPRYCDVIARRFQGWTAEVATLHGDGRSYQEMRAERAPSPPGARHS